MRLVVERRVSPAGNGRGNAVLVRLCGAVLLSGMASMVRADVGLTGFGAWRLQPTASLAQTFTTNANAQATSGGSADAITDAGAGFTLASGAGLVTGLVDYHLSALVYARDQSRSTLRHNLRSHLDAEWYERRGFLSLDATVSQQAISAFGYQPTGSSTAVNANSTETATVRAAPRWVGLLPGGLQTELNGEYSATAVSNSTAGDNYRFNGGVHVAPQSSGRLGWSGDVQAQRSSFRAGRTVDTATMFGSLSYRAVEIDTTLSASAGRQRTDLLSVEQAEYAYWSVGANWVPSQRTSLRGRLDRQAFGKSHELSFEYRTAQVSLRVMDSRSLNSSGNQSGVTELGSAYDVFYKLYASKIPDPAARDAYVRALIGNRSDSSVFGGYLASSVTINNVQSVALGMQWPRDTATLVFSRSSSQRAGRVLTVVDDLTTNNQIRLSGLSLTLTHALTPTASIDLTVKDQATRGELAQQAYNQRGLSLRYTDRFGAAVTGSVGLSHDQYETGAKSSNATAVTAAVAAKF